MWITELVLDLLINVTYIRHQIVLRYDFDNFPDFLQKLFVFISYFPVVFVILSLIGRILSVLFGVWEVYCADLLALSPTQRWVVVSRLSGEITALVWLGFLFIKTYSFNHNWMMHILFSMIDKCIWNGLEVEKTLPLKARSIWFMTFYNHC